MSGAEHENGLPEVVLSTEESTISDEDRADILKEIDKVVDENKIPVSSELFELKPAKKGIFLPFFINIVAVAVIVGGFFLASWYFEQQKETLSTEGQSFLSAEGRLIAELKKEAESKLQEKDSEIGQIQSQLARIEQERTDLEQSMAQQIQAREEELRKSLDKQLALEKSRLQALGSSEADINRQLAELEQRVTAEQSAELEAFRSQAEEALKEKDAELSRNKALTEQILQEAQTERVALEEKSKAREEELVAQYEEEKSALAEQASEAETQLEQIAASQAREKLVADQITGTYSLIEQKIAAGNFAEVRTDLEQLKTLLYQPNIDALSNIAARRESDLFIIGALEELVETRAAVEETKTTDSILQTANLLETARGAVLRADEAYAAGQNDEAKRLYLDALKLVPSFGRAYANLTDIATAESKQILSNGLTTATQRFQAEDISGAVDAYSGALVAAAPQNTDLVSQAVKGISDSFSLSIAKQATQNRDIVDNVNRQLTQERRRAGELEQSLSTAQSNANRLTTENASLRTTISAREASIKSANDRIAGLENDLAAKTSEIEALTARAGDLEAKLTARTLTAADLRTQLAAETTDSAGLANRLAAEEAKTADLEEQLASETEKSAGLEDRLTSETEKSAGLEDQLAAETANSTDLQMQLTAANTSIALLQAKSADLTRQLAAEKSSAGTSENDLAAARDRIDSLTAQVSGLRDLLSRTENRIADLETNLRNADTEIADLKSALEDARAAGQPSGTVDVTLAELQTAYDRYSERLNPLLSLDSEQQVRDAKQILSVFFERVNDRAFPGIYTTWNDIDTAYVNLESGLAEESGRTNALNEVILYVEYLRAGTRASAASRQAFEALSQDDLLYKRAFNEIEDIASRAGSRDIQITWSPAGTVTSFSGGKIEVRVDSDVVAAPGTAVMVKRARADGSEAEIARGVVTSVSGSVMEADLRLYIDPSAPAKDDLVFLETTAE